MRLPGGAHHPAPLLRSRSVARVVFLTDRSPSEALPALASLGLDLKIDGLGMDAIDHLEDLGASAVIVDAEVKDELGFYVVATIAERRQRVPVVVLLAANRLEEWPWQDVADDVVFSSISDSELRVRLGILRRRVGDVGDSVIRLGALSLNAETYRVALAGRTLELTYKEFELLRFLIDRPGRVFGREELLREVWGFDFYGGTRTVDVHVRRLRAKLGPEHEALIQTVRGVGYRAAAPDRIHRD